MPHTLLLIDDDASLRATLTRYFERQGWHVRTAADGRTGLELYERTRSDLVVTDLEMPGLSGLQVIDVLRARDPDAMVLVLAEHDDVATAVEAMQLGAENFLTKPVNYDQLDVVVARAREKAALRRHARHAGPPGSAVDVAPGEFDASPAMRYVGEQLALYAASAAHVLVTGETGVGKGWIARRLHAASDRATGPFVEINCTELAASQLGVELLGQETGSKVGGRAASRGLLEAARGGTLFLDEIGGLAPELQPLLLGVLERGCFRRVGGTNEIESDVRVIAATQADLGAAVRAGSFREDLYYRIVVLNLALPPLRARGAAEIARLAQRSVDESRRRARVRPIPVTDGALRALVRYPWPGNVRELRNVLERAAVLARAADAVDVGHLPAEFRDGPPTGDDGAAAGCSDLSLRAVERAHVLRVLALCGNNKLRAARTLGITRATLYVRLQEYAAEDGARTTAGTTGPRQVARRGGPS